jgi:acyl-CoA synthetase (NDP forming)
MQALLPRLRLSRDTLAWDLGRVLMSENVSESLDQLFYPRSIAVVGASPKRGGMMWGGNSFIAGSIRHNFQGLIHPVHPTAPFIMGLKAYPSVAEIPGDVDLVIFSVPFTAVQGVMSDCVKKGVKFVHLFTAGFSETGKDEYSNIERDVVTMAKEAGIRVVGPNCMGIYCPDGGLAWSDDFPTGAGPVGFFSQSGQMAGQFIGLSAAQSLRHSKVVSFGNASDLKAHDFLNYLAQDEKTEVIGSYLEGLKEGRAFFDAAKAITRTKPLVVLKGGQTEGGSRATFSHTAAIAGSPKIWSALCRQTGILSVQSMDELVYTLVALRKLSLPVGTNVAILGGAGGGSVTMTDAAEKEGLKVPHLTDKTIRSLEEFVPLQGSSVKNPLDMMGTLFRPDNFMRLIKLLRDDPNIDALLFNQMVRRFRGSRSFVDMAVQNNIKAKEILGKPLFIILNGGGDPQSSHMVSEMEETYHNAGIATFPSFRMAARVLYNLKGYRDFLERPGEGG